MSQINPGEMVGTAPAGSEPLRASRREKFAHEIASGKYQSDSFRIAYPNSETWKPETIASRASDLARKPDVRARIDFLRGRVADTWVFDTAEARRLVLEDARDVLLADPSELTTYRRLNCRHCHGRDHAYRWRDDREYWGALARVAAAQEAWDGDARKRGQRPELPTDEGGYGFRKLHPPNPQCPECEGEGIEDVRIADIRTLKGPARRLFNGVKQTKNGLEILQRDREAARQLLAKHLGLIDDKLKVTGAVGVTPMPLTEDMRAAILKAIESDI